VKKIVLNIDDEHLQTVMTILTNLKEGLIESIESNGVKPARKASYAPKYGRVVDESQRPAGKYATAAVYKSRLKKS